MHDWKPPFSAASKMCAQLVMRNGGGDECGLPPTDNVHNGVAVDDAGNFCGRSVETGEFVPSPDGLCGYCGPHCAHCVGYKVYAVQDGVYVCAADYEPRD